MRFFYRFRKAIACIALAVLLTPTSATPAAAYYNPTLGRYVQPDPNGTGLVLTPGLRYHGANPTVTVSMAYQLQFGDGMNFYEFVRGNPVTGKDPMGLWTYGDTLTTATIGGALYGIANTYAHYGEHNQETGSDENWRYALWGGAGAAGGLGGAIGFTWLTGAFASAAGVSTATAATAMGLMLGPPSLGFTAHEYATAETYADKVMAQIDVGLSVMSIVGTHTALLGGVNPGTQGLLGKLAKRVIGKVGPGSGGPYGSGVHTQFAKEVKGLGKNFSTEVSYFRGDPDVKYGHPGSIRVDVVEGPVDRPIAIYDLKTGGSSLTPARVRQIRAHLPKGYQDIPIVEIRGDAP